MLPIIENIPVPSPERLAHFVASQASSIWLDSALPGHPRSRYSLLVAWPVAIVTVDGKGRGAMERRGGEGERGRGEDHVLDRPYAFLDSWLASFSKAASPVPFFCGGVVGWLTYEGEAQWLLVDSGLVIDHQKKSAWVFSSGIQKDLKTLNPLLAKERCDALREALSQVLEPTPPLAVVGSLELPLSREVYLQKIQDIKERIFRGDCYQVNFSQPFVAKGSWDPAGLYLRLRKVSPAPQMAMVNRGNSYLFSSSPETLLAMEQGMARSFPIKGTRPRLPEETADREMKEELLKSEKDAAELLMIVDLVRNDLGKFCELGSVKVPRLKSLESFAQVHHLVAEVEGKMKNPQQPFQALLEVFPGGSITGTPKLKAVEIIREMEISPRGIYTGSIGYAGFQGRACFNIAIRTAVLEKDRCQFFAGGGIVADSEPASEYEETLHKAKGFFEALGLESN